MAVIQDVKDGDIFIKINSLTNMIKGKKIRKKLLDNVVKVEIQKGSIPVFLGFNSPKIMFTFHHPASIEKEKLNEIVGEVSDIVWRRYECGHRFDYVKH